MVLESFKTSLIVRPMKCLLMAYGCWRMIMDFISFTARKGTKSAVNEDMQTLQLSQINQRKPPELWNRAFFFPDYIPEEPNSVSSQIVAILNSAQVSIQVCLYLLSFNPFETAILRKYRDGLIVQVITDHDTMHSHNNHISRWKNKGIPIRMKSTGYLMHNKFVIIDDEALLTGSLNWTVQGVTGNRENVLLTTDPRLVGAYRREFNKMWSEFSNV